MDNSRIARTISGAATALLVVAGTAAAQSSGSMGGSMKKSDMSGSMQHTVMLKGSDGKMAAGHVMTMMKDGHMMIELGQDFKADNGSNDDLVLSPDMMYSEGSGMMVGKLTKSSGKQEFLVPEGTMMDHYKYVLLRDRTSGKVVGMASMGMMKDDGMMKEKGMMKDSGGMMKKKGGGTN